MHSATCDNCDALFEDNHSGFTAFADEEHLQQRADYQGWHFEGDKCYCRDCHYFDDNDKLIIDTDNTKPKSLSERIADDLRNGTFY